MTYRDKIYEQLSIALAEMIQANQDFDTLFRKHVTVEWIESGKRMPEPQRVLSEEGYKELDKAEERREATTKKFLQVLDRYDQTRP